jgi:hypothetical protein
MDKGFNTSAMPGCILVDAAAAAASAPTLQDTQRDSWASSNRLPVVIGNKRRTPSFAGGARGFTHSHSCHTCHCHLSSGAAAAFERVRGWYVHSLLAKCHESASNTRANRRRKAAAAAIKRRQSGRRCHPAACRRRRVRPEALPQRRQAQQCLRIASRPAAGAMNQPATGGAARMNTQNLKKKTFKIWKNGTLPPDSSLLRRVRSAAAAT